MLTFAHKCSTLNKYTWALKSVTHKRVTNICPLLHAYMSGQILAVSPGCIECLDGMAQVAFDNSQYESAIDLWSQAVAVAQEPNWELYVKIGLCHQSSKHHSVCLCLCMRVPVCVRAGVKHDMYACCEDCCSRILKRHRSCGAFALYAHLCIYLYLHTCFHISRVYTIARPLHHAPWFLALYE